MSVFLGLDTSNYTTSAACYNSETETLWMEKELLPVKEGALGLKQSDAVFQHVKQLPNILDRLLGGRRADIEAIGVSVSPRRCEGSYMPCFLVGNTLASSLASVLSVPLFSFSHQEGHIMAALYSSGRMTLLSEAFYAFHVSGGTTECLLTHYEEGRFNVQLVAASLDLKAGQAVDRVGALLGLPFPAGRELDILAGTCKDQIIVRPCIKGTDCSLSGLENQCQRLLREGKPREYIAKYCIVSIMETLAAMTEEVFRQYGRKTVIYAGGVMSNSMIRNHFKERFQGGFAAPEYASDNSAGIALLTAFAQQGKGV